MPSLDELKTAIDRGKRAKLRLWRSILYMFVEKKGQGYLKRMQGYRNPDGVLVVEPREATYEQWNELMDGLGYDGDSHGWELLEENRVE